MRPRAAASRATSWAAVAAAALAPVAAFLPFLAATNLPATAARRAQAWARVWASW
ncbi:MAG: hypothetical protein KKA32_10990 [Actinobacteria bacterium]|nr:hypothetical protein [Actinomycetota bacterium]